MTEQMNVPKLRFGDFSDGLSVTQLSEIISKLESGVSVNSEDVPPNSNEFGILKTSAIYAGSFIPEQAKVITDESELQRAKLNPKKDSIIISRMNTPALVGESGYISKSYSNLFIPDRLWQATVSDKYSARWLSYLLTSPRTRFIISSKGTGTSNSMKNISKPSFLSIEAVTPVLSEQQKIASFLSKVDEKISLLTEKKDKLIEYKKGVMQQLFNGKWQEQDGQLTFIPPTLRFKADDGSEFPDWEEKKLGDLFSISAGGDISKEHSNSVKTDKFKYPVFANAETNKGLHSYSDIYKISQPCLTVSGRGSLGNAVFRDEPFYPIVRLLVLKAALPVDLKFYEYAINKLNIFNESTGVPQLTAPQLRTYAIVMPCIEEQKKIARAIESLDRKIDLVLLELEKAKEWKKGLLQQMFV
ncbi:restriction endonuclease subunit S [Vibrio parahaemolyticus]|uniref:restriction endonuclease subunit S n=1 Tax=Vibrio parahaemolyticus TaxID=670 RepID=UPI00041C3E21|nr:restriction endonuclease subunit S [Vibrio parahaemolyticus]ELA8919473.1 restriction endonuclease subunit S [Vibrio parahaemolyticus]ELM4052117.1 restriction endonuclease subunit S [Vibrio parahaemolyticus]MDF5667282.1 restriction endonuclease subunit S [Vibrio parahaemolyticus]QUD92552.1 restriction endonuclease subunit S [Vibrio parahaemolyticus]HCG5953984.1 restriction endonuclease subunit S [Vibrio parahaemolyticus]